jgi:hypothetical protein
MQQQNQTSAIDPNQLALVQERLKLTNQFSGGAGWFYWIAPFSMVNSVIFLAGGQWSFFIGLGATQIIDTVATAIGNEVGSNAELILKVIAFGIDLALAGLVAACGYLARKRHKLVYVAGMVLYGLDALIFLAVFDWLSLGFYVFALFCLYSGLKALGSLQALEQTQPLPL